jgi:hypothetical protein
VFIYGFPLIGKITEWMQTEVDSIQKLFTSGLCMAWINITVSVMVPDTTGIGAGLAEMVCTITLVSVLQALEACCPSTKTLRGYVEWHIASTILSIAFANGMSKLDVVMLASALLGLVVKLKDSSGKIRELFVNILTIVIVNTSTQHMVRIATTRSSFELVSVLFIVTIAMECVLAFTTVLLK